MASRYSIEKLELNSQVQLLSRIQFLMRFSSNLVQVVGDKGYGKTWLCESYLEHWASEPKQVLLLCNDKQKEEQHRTIILRQIVREGIFNEFDPLIDSLSNLLKDEPLHALIVIDDAELLSQNLVKELWQLVKVAQERIGWQINVLLFSKPSKLNKWLQKAAKNQKEKPLELEISPLTDIEREQLTTAITQAIEMDSSARRSFKMRAQDAPSYPGPIIDVALPKVEIGAKKKKRSLFIPITVALLLLMLAATVVFWLQIPSGMTPGQYLTHLFESKINPITSKHKIPSFDISSQSKEDQIALPNNPQGNGLTVGRSDSEMGKTTKELLTDEQIDAMIEKQGDGSEPVDDLFFEGASENVLTSLGNSQKNSISLDGVNNNEIPLANNMLLAIPSSRYALQLGAFQTRPELDDFIRQHDLGGRVLVYETRRGGVPWYMVLLGDYPSAVEARRMEMQLSQELRALKPWAKSFTQIHKEINLVQ